MESTRGKRPNMQRRINETVKDSVAMSNFNPLGADCIQNQNCSVETDALKLHEFCFSGHMTRRAKRTLQTAISNGLMCVPVISNSDLASATLSSCVLTTCSSSSTSKTGVQSSPISSPNVSSSLTATLSPSSLGTSSEVRNIIKPCSIIADILTGDDKVLGENVVTDNDEDDKEFTEPQGTLDMDCTDVSSYLEETMRGSSLLGKFETSTTDWDLEPHIADCATKEAVATPDSDLTPVLDNMSCINTWNKCALFLIAQDDNKGAQLQQDIRQALQIPAIQIVKPSEAVEVCSVESCVMIWMQVPIPVQEDILCTVSSLRYCSKKATSTYFIAITDKQSDVDLCLHGFDDVYVEPIPKDVIFQKYRKLKFVPLQETSVTDSVVMMRDTTGTPESTISLESIRTADYSRSSTCDSVSSGMEIHDLNLSELKSTLTVPLCSKSPFLSESTETEGGRSPILDPQSPNWCRLEHATKEKQRSLLRKLPAHTEKERRERIKDSCDQLRVLLPYVKGRKTDMASILEMTVDYLKIVNAALPQDFQSRVIEIMSNGNPSLEARLEEMVKESTANKKVTRRRISDLSLSPLGKKQQVLEKANTHMNYDCNFDQSLNKKMNRPASHTDGTTAAIDKVTMTSNPGNIKGCPSQKINSTNVTKRECSLFKKSGSNKPKRPHMALVSSAGEVMSPSVIYLPTGNITPIKETKKENIHGEATNQSHHFTDNQFSHLFTDADIPGNHMFTPNNITSDMFAYQSHAQMNMNAPLSRVSASDRGDLTAYGGIYFDGAFCHYYPQLQDPSNSGYFGSGGNSEYVNPNAVLPMATFVPRSAAFTSSHKFDRTSAEFDRYGTIDQKSDIFNNNCSMTGLKPNNA